MLVHTNFVNAEIKNSHLLLSSKIQDIIFNTKKPFRDIAIVCVGTDRSTGDSYGPLVGLQLNNILKDEFQNVTVYGNLHEPVHATNLELTMRKINKSNTLVIAVDASVGRVESIGKIYVDEKSLRPGTGLDKSLPPIGDISITAIVNASANDSRVSFLMLQSTRLSLVYDLANITARALHHGLMRVNQLR